MADILPERWVEMVRVIGLSNAWDAHLHMRDREPDTYVVLGRCFMGRVPDAGGVLERSFIPAPARRPMRLEELRLLADALEALVP